MIRLEDKELEDYVLGDECHIALPFELHRKSDGINEIITYSFTKKIVENFEKEFGDNPFSDGAKLFLKEELGPVMEKLGYDCDGALDVVHYEYRCSSADKSKILPNCEIIDTLEGEDYDGVPLDEFSLDTSDEADRMAVIRENGKIVCFAGLNDIAEDDGCTEITVECAENHRKKGYGASCVAALTDYLLTLGADVKYVCTADNIPSIKTAEAAGFVLYDKCLPFVCYRDIEDEDDEEI